MSSRHVTGVHKRTASQLSNNIRKEDVEEKKSSSKQSPDVASRQSMIKNRWIKLVVILLAIYTLYTQVAPTLSRLGSVYTDPVTKITSEILLDSVVTDTNSRPSWMDEAAQKNRLRYPQALQRDSSLGHTNSAIKRLERKRRPKYSNIVHKLVSVTAILAIDSSIDILSQVDAVLAQSVHPEHIWIVADSDVHLPKALTADYLPHYVGFRVFYREHIGERNWISVANLATTDFTWVMTNGVRPGIRYLERLLRLSQTDEYRYALIGTEGAILPFSGNMTTLDVDEMTCFPQAIEAGELPNMSVAVDMLTDTWLLRQEWVPIIMAQTTPQLSLVPIGFRISLTLNYVGITTVTLPINPIEVAYWGDIREHTRTMHEQGSFSCRQKKEELTFNRDWYHILTRNQHTLVTEIRELAENADDSVDVAFLVSNLDELNAITPIMCTFIEKERSVHLINVGHHSVARMRSGSSLNAQSNCHPDHVYDVNPTSFANDRVFIDHIQIIPKTHALLQLLKPRIVFHPSRNAMWTTLANLDTDVTSTFIALPSEDLKHMSWMATLPIDALMKWNSVDIRIIVITSQRPDSLTRLLRSIGDAHYFGDSVKLTINMERSVDRVTKMIVDNFEWTHGEKAVRHRIKQAGAMSAFVESWYPSNNNEYAIFLEDKIEVSPFFYSWAKFCVLKYRYAEEQDVSKKMFGISLYSPPGTGLHLEGTRPFDPSKLNSSKMYGSQSPYLLQIPSNLGAVYFPEHWQEFHDYITARLLDKKQLQHIAVPGSRSNEWESSWKRYFVELIYMRGYVMLYPNFESFKSFSTHLLDSRTPITNETDLANQTDLLELAEVPLITEGTIINDLPNKELPNWDDLPVFNLFAIPSRLSQLHEEGVKLQMDVSACDPEVAGTIRFDPSDLLCPFPKQYLEAITKAEDKQEDPNVRYVTVYVVGQAPTPAVATEDVDIDHWKADNLTSGNSMINHYDEQAFNSLVSVVQDQLEAEGPNFEMDDDEEMLLEENAEGEISSPGQWQSKKDALDEAEPLTELTPEEIDPEELEWTEADNDDTAEVDKNSDDDDSMDANDNEIIDELDVI